MGVVGQAGLEDEYCIITLRNTLSSEERGQPWQRRHPPTCRITPFIVCGSPSYKGWVVMGWHGWEARGDE